MDLKNIVILIFSSLLLTSCINNMIAVIWLDDGYFLSSSFNAQENYTLYKELDDGHGIGRVTDVKKLGMNPSYIIVLSYNENDSTEKYWVLDKIKDNKYFNAEDIMEGPYTKDEFNTILEQKGISNLEFDQFYE